MSRSKKITGQVFRKDIGLGAWGIRSENGSEYRPVNFPEQLKDDGAMVSVWILPVEEEMSIHMWGIPVKITSFSTTLK